MKQRKPLPKAALIGIAVAAALLVAVVGYSVLIKPQKAQLKSVKADIDSTNATIQQYLAAAAAAKPTVAPKVKVADIYRLARAMPSTEGMADILVELDSLARSAGVQLGGISPGVPTAGNGFQIVPIALTFSGDFFATTDFLYRLRTIVDVRHGQLEAGGRIFAVQQGTLTPSPDSRILSGQVSIQTYVYGAGTTGTTAPAAPAAAPATPTTTAATTPTTTSAAPTSASAEGAP